MCRGARRQPFEVADVFVQRFGPVLGLAHVARGGRKVAFNDRPDGVAVQTGKTFVVESARGACRDDPVHVAKTHRSSSGRSMTTRRRWSTRPPACSSASARACA